MRNKSTYIKDEIKDYISIFFGLIIYALGWTLFLLPYKITSGGLTGVSAIVYYVTGIEVQVTYSIVNCVLLLFAMKMIGVKFCVKTIYGVAMLSIIFWALQTWLKGDTGELPQILGDNQEFMASIIGSLCCGIGLAKVFLHQGSTGGTDIIAAIVSQRRNVTLGKMILYCDLVIISSNYLIFYDPSNPAAPLTKVVFGFVTMFVVSFTLDYAMNLKQQSVQFLIISENYQVIEKAVLKKLNRGATRIPAVGCYSGKDVQVLMVIVRSSQSVEVFRMIKDLDPNAFIAQSRAMGVFGEGFDVLRT